MPEFVARQTTLAPFADNQYSKGIATRLGLQAVCDFYTYMMLAGRAFQVRAGTLSVPLVGDVLITDTAAEMCVDCVSGDSIIPVKANIAINLGAATLFEYAAKSVATVSSVGTAFIPLPLLTNGSAASTTARVMPAGGVTVTAELATTTRQHWVTGHPIAYGAHPASYLWEPRMPPVLVGPYCFYLQIAADTTGPSYFANAEYIEVPTATLL